VNTGVREIGEGRIGGWGRVRMGHKRKRKREEKGSKGRAKDKRRVLKEVREVIG